MTIFVRPSLASLSTLGLILGVAGCPGPSPSDDAAAVADAASPDAPSALDAHVHEDDAPAIDAFTASDAPSSVDAPASPLDAPGADAPPLDAPGALEVELTETFAYGNCFGGPPDPLLAGFTLRVTGAMGDRVEITNAKLRVVVESRGYDETQDLIVAPSASAHTRTGTDEYMIRKESGSPSIPMCTFCSDTVTGDLSFDVTTLAGTEHYSEPVELGCVF